MDKPLSLVRGASGKVILAFLEPEQREAVLRAEAEALPAGAGTAAEGDLAATLGEIRRKHFWISEGEKLPGACGIAAPVFNTDGVAGCLCLTAPRETLPASGLDDIGRAIARHARSLSKNLGADPFP
jgi:DNA-binding IclR family transcriptional regulator